MVATWVKDNWRWAILNGIAFSIMANLLRHAYQVGDLGSNMEPLVDSGKWAVRFLLISLSITPLNTLFGWRSAIPLRKPAGLWAFAFGLLHFVFYLADLQLDWLKYPIPDYIAGLGIVALIILSLLAATSTRWAMKRMGKRWKKLHRLVYIGGIAALVHGLLESLTSKRVLIVDPVANYEVAIYLILLVVLLVVRIPVIRIGLANLRHRTLKDSRVVQ
jgi:methionine sulfoxide reductase heme-binding subunit